MVRTLSSASLIRGKDNKERRNVKDGDAEDCVLTKNYYENKLGSSKPQLPGRVLWEHRKTLIR